MTESGRKETIPAAPEAFGVPEFVMIEFEKWWADEWWPNGGLPTDGNYARSHHMARSAWREAYKRGLDVNY